MRKLVFTAASFALAKVMERRKQKKSTAAAHRTRRR